MRKKTKTLSRTRSLWMCSLNLLLGASLCVFAQDARGQDKNKQTLPLALSEIMSTTPYAIGEKKRWLILIKQPITWESMEKFAYINRHPNGPPPFNVAFLIIDSKTKEPVEGKVVGVVFDMVFERDRPSDVLHGQLLWRAESREAYVVILKVPVERQIRVFRIDPTQELGKYPLRLEPKNRSEWPQPIPLLSEFKQGREDVRGSEDLIYPLEKLELSIEKDILQIRGLRQDKDYPPLLLNLDLRTKEWREISEPKK